ncbi:MAG: formyltransferase family protein [Hyphomicrobiales bacterium]
MKPVVVLTKDKHFDFVRSVLPAAILAEQISDVKPSGCLIAFMTGVIVPSPVLSKFHRTYNFHAASPDYPGRDPHHWAAYDGAPIYGATAHHMDARVDEGIIVGTLTVGVPKDFSPQDYLAIGEMAVKALFSVLAPIMVSDGVPATGIKWSGKKHSRADLLAKCDMRQLDEFAREHREMAFAGFEQHFIAQSN